MGCVTPVTTAFFVICHVILKRVCTLLYLYGVQPSDNSALVVSEICVDDVPENHPLLKVKKLEEEGKQAFEMILAYQASPHISRSVIVTMQFVAMFLLQAESLWNGKTVF